MSGLLHVILLAEIALQRLAYADSGDSGDTGTCSGPHDSAVYQDDMCIFSDMADCCGSDGCRTLADYLDGNARTKLLWDCAPGSEVAHVYYQNSTEFVDFVWFDAAGNKIGSAHTGWYCCQGLPADTLICGPPLGTCLAPVLTALPDDPPPISPEACEDAQGCGGCSGNAAPRGLWVFALTALRRRR